MPQGPAEVAHGYMLTGLIFNVLLFGIMITQVYLYYTTYKRDHIWMKSFVAFIFLADIVNTVFCYVDLYRALILRFGEVEMLFTADWIFATEPATTAIIATCVQLFFAWRVRVLTRQWKKISWVLVAMVASTALTSGIAGVLTAWEVVRHPHFAEFQKFHHTVSTWLGATCACDALITIILVVALRRQKTGFQRSDLIVDRIIKLTMQTGLLTMVVAALDLVFYLVSTSGLHLLFSYPLSKLYTNSLMSTLNARKSAFYGSSTASHTNGTDTDGVNTSSGFKNGVSGISRASTHFTLRRDRTSKAVSGRRLPSAIIRQLSVPH
ncbi:hypothetical protein CC2G_014104 [Coprinopsis cinerea AmutBmut pab1-1]|nr:hypothetical protein CC2G_014104 [Coprinopsis cinerea AmutBmut pab1-1]